MNKKMRLWVAGTVGVLMTGLMSVNAYALEEKDVIGTWYVNELSMEMCIRDSQNTIRQPIAVRHLRIFLYTTCFSR